MEILVCIGAVVGVGCRNTCVVYCNRRWSDSIECSSRFCTSIFRSLICFIREEFSFCRSKIVLCSFLFRGSGDEERTGVVAEKVARVTGAIGVSNVEVEGVIDSEREVKLQWLGVDVHGVTCGVARGGVGVRDDLEDGAGDAGAGDVRRLKVIGWSPVCLSFVTDTVCISASLLIAAPHVLPRQRHEISPFFKTL